MANQCGWQLDKLWIGQELEDLCREKGVIEIMDIIPSKADQRVRELEEQLRRANLQLKRNLPECPVSWKFC